MPDLDGKKSDQYQFLEQMSTEKLKSIVRADFESEDSDDAVTQTATHREDGGDLIRHFHRHVFGHIRVIPFQVDRSHRIVLHFKVFGGCGLKWRTGGPLAVGMTTMSLLWEKALGLYSLSAFCRKYLSSFRGSYNCAVISVTEKCNFCTIICASFSVIENIIGV